MKKILSSPGGVTRDIALARAGGRLNDARAAALEGLAAKIEQIERMGETMDAMPLTCERLVDLFDRLNEILNVAGTYQLWNLVTTTALLYDILRSDIGRFRLTPDSLRTFALAMQLFAMPGGIYQSDGLILLEQLRRLFNHVVVDAATPQLREPA